ncbi:MAG: hypothetical protein CMJ76_13520 [Planctomycetaceae bacterium]|nr:hypothetical protein [Planctomycetaceae bacterium]
MFLRRSLLTILLTLWFTCRTCNGNDNLTHLRNGDREWASFPAEADATSLTHSFTLSDDKFPQSFSLQQIDVKQQWTIAINGKSVGRLIRNENHQTIVFDLPPGILQSGDNTLTVTQTGNISADDIYVGAIRFHSMKRADYLSQCTVPVRVINKETNQLTPCRITVINSAGSLMSIGNTSTDTTAVRVGVIYTSNGDVKLKLPPGSYTICAGRGVEWSLESVQVVATTDSSDTNQLSIRREVDTRGFVSCDTHVHTFTHSRHGDATLDERMVTIVGEGIELPIATDHNLHIDYAPRMQELNLQRYFTPVIGNEVTTPTGHFNIFPVPRGSPLPDHTSKSWADTIDSIKTQTGAKIIILNHARDIHGGVTPFSPERHISLTGNSFGNGSFPANAMELINSGATQTDVMQLYRDWFGLLNRGISVTGIGCSDSHDVARHFIGQGRTYIRTKDDNPGAINVENAIAALAKGQANVSYGLFTTMRVNDAFRSGDMAIGTEPFIAKITVQGPGWVTARQLDFYLNGHLTKTIRIPRGQRGGIKWTGRVRLDQRNKDAFIVAVASGDGVDSLHWPTAKPYQPQGMNFQPYTIGSTGVIRIDFDGDGKYSSARDYALRIVKVHVTTDQIIQVLSDYDLSVVIQVAELLDDNGTDLSSDPLLTLLQDADAHVRLGFNLYRRSKFGQ